MKANELRIGNWVSAGNASVEVKSISKDGINIYADYEPVFFHEYLFTEDSSEPKKIAITPIPITEEWLQKFGCDWLGNIEMNLLNVTHFLQVNNSGEISIYKSMETNIRPILHLNQIEYVHQLQNLYFALTGEELILKS